MTAAAPRRPRALPTRLRPRRLTLRLRLTLVYGGLFLASGVVLLGATYALFNQQLTRGDSGLSVHGEGTGTPPPARDGQRPPEQSTFEQSTFEEQEQNRINDAALTTLLTQGFIALGVVGAAAGGLGWLLAGRVLAPLHQVTATARRIASAPSADRGLHERIALGGAGAADDEVKDLATSFDTMLERLDASFDGQRRFVANASHELRTPLTLNRSLVEMAMHRKTASDDVKQLGEHLLEINSRHERLITGLLLLASTENHVPELTPVDLADVVTHVVGQTGAEAHRRGVTVDGEAGHAPTSGDPLLLERLVHNLVENGIRHNTGEDGRVRVVSRVRDRGHVEIEVTNTGPEIPPYEIPTLFEPFRRLGTERLVTAKGAGLGLSIARAVARAHGGDIAARPGGSGGLTVTVTLPRGPTRSAHERPPGPALP
ncbi:sensor histidine kinase [Streptomyces polyrhachis]|uniref:histidine kinase n=1 Tax=Streptomyces polyrhachis TaxID=1282885 RepID=A0ABW2GII7_9ACTN